MFFHLNYSFIYLYCLIYSFFLYMYSLCPMFHHTPKEGNKTSYEAPSFHTSGTPWNVPYTILIHSQVKILIQRHEKIHFLMMIILVLLFFDSLTRSGMMV